jgi:hypothetical protein
LNQLSGISGNDLSIHRACRGEHRRLVYGLWDYADKNGNRKIHEPLAAELYRAQQLREKTSRNVSPKRRAWSVAF